MKRKEPETERKGKEVVQENPNGVQGKSKDCGDDDDVNGEGYVDGLWETGNYSSSDDEDGNTVVVDSSVLDCPVCFEPLQLPLFQCTSGHLICPQCCVRLDNKCPLCTLTISRARCLPLESLIESNQTTCPYERFGCEEFLVYNQKRTHKESCMFAPCFCPFPPCRSKASINVLSSHIGAKHHSFKQQRSFTYGCSFRVSLPKEQFFYLLHGKDDLKFLLLNSHSVKAENALSVVCIRPGSECGDLSYDLQVVGDMGRRLQLKGFPENVRKWRVEYTPKFYLNVPNELIGSSGQIKVKVCILWIG